MKEEKRVRLLGVDPGTVVLGFAIIEATAKQIGILEIGVVHLKKYDNHYLRLQQIYQRLQRLIQNYGPREMAIEAPFYGKNVQSMLKLGRAQGVAMAAGMMHDVAITEYSPKKIKQSITGNGNATKEQVAAMLENILKVKLDDYVDDATDALATAICHHYQSQSLFSSSKKYNNWENFLKDNRDRVK